MRVFEGIVVLLALTVFTAVPVLVWLKQRKQTFQNLLLAGGFGLAWLGTLLDLFWKDPRDPAVVHLFILLGMGAAAFAFLGKHWLEIRDQVTDLAGKVGVGPKAPAPKPSASPTPPPPSAPGAPTPPAPEAPAAPPPPTAPAEPEAPTLPPMDLPPKEDEEKPPPPPPPPPA